MSEAGRGGVLLIGVGNELRGDDGAGIEVVRRLRDRARGLGIDVAEEQNEPTALIERWHGRRALVLVDAVDAGPPGTLRRWEASREPLPSQPRGSSSTHAVGLDEAIELARALGKLPPRVVVYAVAGSRFDAGTGLSQEVLGALPELTEQVLAEARSLAGGVPQAQ